MSITKKLMSFSLALFIALGVLVCPLFANKSKADTRVAYSGIGVIDDFLNDPRWSEGNEWTSSTTPKLASGGTGSYKYAVYYKSSSASTWNTKQDFNSNNTTSIKFSGKGTKNVCIKVKDSSETVVKKYFTVTVK